MKNESLPKVIVADIPMNRARRKLGDAVYGFIFAKSAGRCQFCNKLLYEHQLTTEDCNLAELAHIVAFKEAGPRGDKIKSSLLDGKECNFLLLCHDCHRLIDHEGKYKYTEEYLVNLKREREEEIRELTEIISSCKTNCIVYTAKIGTYMPTISNEEIKLALKGDRKYPACREPINLCGSDYGMVDSDSGYWAVENTRLETHFRERVFNGNENIRQIQDYSVFALAPQPLLVRLGTLLESKTTVHVYQRHREPKETWEWLPSEYHDELCITGPQPESRGFPVLILAISADAIIENVRSQLSDCSENIWVVKASNPNYSWCANRFQQRHFRETVRCVLNIIKNQCPGEPIHVFMAMPNSLAIEFGRLWMPKADSSLLLYDIDRETKLYNMVLKIVN